MIFKYNLRNQQYSLDFEPEKWRGKKNWLIYFLRTICIFIPLSSVSPFYPFSPLFLFYYSFGEYSCICVQILSHFFSFHVPKSSKTNILKCEFAYTYTYFGNFTPQFLWSLFFFYPFLILCSPPPPSMIISLESKY